MFKKNKNIYYLLLLFVLILVIYVVYRNKVSVTKVLVKDEQEDDVSQKDIQEQDEEDIDDIVSQISKDDEIKQKCKLKENKYDMNGSKCQSTKVELCKLGSYDQCTNNKKPKFKSCDCSEPNSILCNDNDNLSEKCLHDYKVFENKKPLEDNKNNTRVNIFHSTKKTVFDKLK